MAADAQKLGHAVERLRGNNLSRKLDRKDNPQNLF
jgi:hypothetical protein